MLHEWNASFLLRTTELQNSCVCVYRRTAPTCRCCCCSAAGGMESSQSTPPRCSIFRTKMRCKYGTVDVATCFAYTALRAWAPNLRKYGRSPCIFSNLPKSVCNWQWVLQTVAVSAAGSCSARSKKYESTCFDELLNIYSAAGYLYLVKTLAIAVECGVSSLAYIDMHSIDVTVSRRECVDVVGGALGIYERRCLSTWICTPLMSISPLSPPLLFVGDKAEAADGSGIETAWAPSLSAVLAAAVNLRSAMR